MNKILFLLIIILTVSSCGSEIQNDEPNISYKVDYKGALKDMMHKGDISSKAELSDYNNIPHLYAIGAIENLKGEIQIWDGNPFNTTVVDDSLIFDKSFDKNATLFVYASVEKWNSIEIPDSVQTYQQLESFIATSADHSNIDINEPFPFLLEGMAHSFDWHVINWKDGDTEHSHEKHVNSGLHGTRTNTEVNMLGFYSNSHHTIFTHHTTNMHIHVKTADDQLAGHVDNLTLSKGMTLMLPDVE